MGTHRISYVDVFTEEPLLGNPVAVVFDAESLDEATMRQIAAFTNLSETVFVLPGNADVDYRLRIFTPRSELPFAGHPTIGACYAVRAHDPLLKRKTEMTQGCAAGLIPLFTEGSRIYARVPRPIISHPDVETEQLHRALGTSEVLDPLVILCGPRWLTVALPSIDALYALHRDEGAIVELSKALRVTGITAYAIDGFTPHVRSFAPIDGVSEDPVCGSGNACVGAHLRATGRDALTGDHYLAMQGRSVGREGHVVVRLDDDDVLIGGACVTVIEGSITLR